MMERSFYVDNCLESLSSPHKAKQLVDKLRTLLAAGGFEIRQWASNVPSVVGHLPKEALSNCTELWLSHDRAEMQESTLGLRWNCSSDTLGYKHRSVQPAPTTMQHIYKVMASQYDPQVFILPFTTCAKILIQRLWDKQKDWYDPMLPENLLRAWKK